MIVNQSTSTLRPTDVLSINARFLGQRMTGVQRHAYEVSRRFVDRAELVRPGRGASSGIGGHAWEQLSLPLRVKKRVLWSPCMTGPLAIRRQVLTLHDTSFIDTPEYFGKKFVAWYRWLIPRLVRRVAAILTVSEFSKRQIVRYFDVAPRRITVVPNGVEGFAPASPELIAAARGWFRLENDYLLYVGSLKPSKNLAGLLAAWERSRLAADGVQLAIAGGLGPVFGKCDLERLPPGVKLLGYVEDEWLPALYSGALAFVFPTLYEGFGMPAVEAMACRTAVVTSDCTSMPEIVGDAALLVDPRSVESISAGMRRIVEDETLRTGLQLRGSTMSRQYSWERAADLTWAAIERVRQAS